MKTALLLEKLEGQLATLRQRCAPVSQFATLVARFDRHLFRLVRQHWRLCSRRAGDNLAALRHTVEQQRLPQKLTAGRYLAAQPEAIAREASAQSYAEWDSAPRKLPAGSVNVFSIRILSGSREMVARYDPSGAGDRSRGTANCIVKWKAYEARTARCRHALEKNRG